MYDPCQHGRAEYSSWMNLTSAQWAAIEEGPEGIPFEDRKYAQLVYQVNPSTGGGGGTSDTVSINGTVPVSGSISTEPLLTQVLVQYDDPVNTTYTYVMESLPGVATSGETGWRIKRIYDGDYITIMWADGVDTFTKIASAYLSYNYTYKV